MGNLMTVLDNRLNCKREAVYVAVKRITDKFDAVPVWNDHGIVIHRVLKWVVTDHVDLVPGSMHCLIGNSTVSRYYLMLKGESIGRLNMALESIMPMPDDLTIADDYFEA